MSYILDALKKSDNERSASNIPTLVTTRSAVETPSPTGQWLPVLIGIGIGLLLFTLVLLWINREQTPVPLSQQASTSPPAPQTSAVATKMIAAVPPSAQPLPSNTSAAAPIDTRTNRSMKWESTNQDVSPAQPAADELQPLASPPPSRSLTQAAALPSAPTPAPAEDKMMARVDALTPDVVRSMPPMNVNVVSYSRTPSQRFVMLNQAIYREGDDLGNGITIDEITADGPIVNWDGGRYLIKP